MATERPDETQGQHRTYPTPAEVFQAVIRIQQKLAEIVETMEIQAMIDKKRGK